MIERVLKFPLFYLANQEEILRIKKKIVMREFQFFFLSFLTLFSTYPKLLSDT